MQHAILHRLRQLGSGGGGYDALLVLAGGWVGRRIGSSVQTMHQLWLIAAWKVSFHVAMS